MKNTTQTIIVAGLLLLTDIVGFGSGYVIGCSKTVKPTTTPIDSTINKVEAAAYKIDSTSREIHATDLSRIEYLDGQLSVSHNQNLRLQLLNEHLMNDINYHVITIIH